MRILAPGRPWEGRAPGRVEPSPNRYPLGNPPPPRLLVPGPAPPRTPPPPSGRLNDGPADCGADGVAMRVWTAGAGRLWIDGAAPWEAVPAESPSPLFAMVCKYTGRCADALTCCREVRIAPRSRCGISDVSKLGATTCSAMPSSFAAAIAPALKPTFVIMKAL